MSVRDHLERAWVASLWEHPPPAVAYIVNKIGEHLGTERCIELADASIAAHEESTD